MTQESQKKKEHLSPCCQATIWTALGDGSWLEAVQLVTNLLYE
jgi:hypothetical protein